jgi:hypothetical protein
MSFLKSTIAMAVAACCVSAAQAQLDPPVFTSGSETSSRYNVNATSTTYPTGRPDAVAFAPVYVTANGGSQLRVNQVSVGIRRVGAAATPAPAVTVEVTLAEMTFDGTNYGLGNTVATFTQDLAASTTAFTQTVQRSWGDNDPSLRPVVNLQTLSNGANGYAGLWVGVRFTGANSGNSANGWRIAIEPALGRSVNTFGINDPFNTGWGGNYYFGTTVGTDGVTRENMARFVVGVNGLVTNAGTAPAGMVYGRLFETTTYWKPTDNADGVGSRWFYNSMFPAANVGDAFKPSKVTFGVYRGGSIALPAPAVGVELALVKMNWDGTAYTPGDVVATQVFNLPSSSSAQTDRVEWTFSNPATAPVVALNTDNTANPGLGGMYVAARLLGDSTTLAGNNGARLVYAPAIGASFNSFGMYDSASGSPVFGNYTFGQYNWTYTTTTGTTAYYVKPSRFLAEASGVVGPAAPPPPPCPADLNGDRQVNGADLGLMLGSWGPCPSNPCAADLNGDNQVNGADLGLMLGAWGACPQ